MSLFEPELQNLVKLDPVTCGKCRGGTNLQRWLCIGGARKPSEGLKACTAERIQCWLGEQRMMHAFWGAGRKTSGNHNTHSVFLSLTFGEHQWAQNQPRGLRERTGNYWGGWRDMGRGHEKGQKDAATETHGYRRLLWSTWRGWAGSTRPIHGDKMEQK